MTHYDPYARLGLESTFSVNSDDMADGTPLKLHLRSSGIGGGDTSPHLAWSGFPPETKSFAVTAFDPDALTGSGFWHWAVYNIPASVTSLPAGAGDLGSALLLEGAITLSNEYRLEQYSGAQPPEGTGIHRYFFVVHAVDTERLEILEGSTPAVLGFNLFFHALGRAILVPTATFDDFDATAELEDRPLSSMR